MLSRDAVLVTVRSIIECNGNIVFLNSKISMSRIRYIWLHVESADLMWGSGQVSPGTVRCEYKLVVYGLEGTWKGRRDGTASVVVLGQAATG
jgi:hypothetical protein